MALKSHLYKLHRLSLNVARKKREIKDVPKAYLGREGTNTKPIHVPKPLADKYGLKATYAPPSLPSKSFSKSESKSSPFAAAERAVAAEKAREVGRRKVIVSEQIASLRPSLNIVDATATREVTMTIVEDEGSSRSSANGAEEKSSKESASTATAEPPTTSSSAASDIKETNTLSSSPPPTPASAPPTSRASIAETAPATTQTGGWKVTAATNANAGFFKVTIIRSLIGVPKRERAILNKLRLEKVKRHSHAYHPHTSYAASQILKVKELIKVENVPSTPGVWNPRMELFGQLPDHLRKQDAKAARGFKVIGSFFDKTSEVQ